MALTSLIAPATKLIGKFVKDKTKQMELAHEISTMAEKHSQELALAQIKLNTEEAKGNWFQSSWRPLCGWICAISLGINFMVAPICAGFGINIPQADMSIMMPLLLGMLGIGGLRSLDKIKKVDTKGSVGKKQKKKKMKYKIYIQTKNIQEQIMRGVKKIKQKQKKKIKNLFMMLLIMYTTVNNKGG